MTHFIFYLVCSCGSLGGAVDTFCAGYVLCVTTASAVITVTMVTVETAVAGDKSITGT